MSNVIELNPVDFVTIGTIGPKGQRTFHLQAGQDHRIVSFTIEKEQAHALSSAISELLADIDERDNSQTEANFSELDMDLREPIEPLFRIAQMGLAYEAHNNQVILIAQEHVPQAKTNLTTALMKMTMMTKTTKISISAYLKVDPTARKWCVCGAAASKCARSACTPWTR